MKKRSIICHLVLYIMMLPAYVEPADRLVEVAGTVRVTAEKGWHLLEDDTHAGINVESVKVGRGSVIIKFPFQAKKIHTFVATPDDTFALRGYYIGSSVSRGQARILISNTTPKGESWIEPSRLDEPFGNIWFYGLFSVEN